MAIVSDSWPGLERLYRRLGLDAYFQAFVISASWAAASPIPACTGPAATVPWIGTLEELVPMTGPASSDTRQAQ
jgi:hypothetical protein